MYRLLLLIPVTTCVVMVCRYVHTLTVRHYGRLPDSCQESSGTISLRSHTCNVPLCVLVSTAAISWNVARLNA
jgi:hypothetical protein